MNKTIIVAEDEPKLAQLMADYLVQAGYQPILIDNGAAVESRVKSVNPAAILLDIMMPNKDGISILRALREWSDVPVLFMTARVDEIDRILGLELGADDYICKPFSPREVIARLNTVLRRSNRTNTQAASTFELNSHRYVFQFNQKEQLLSAVEFQLMEKLCSEPDRIFSRLQLMNAMYKDHRIVNDRTIDSHIKKMRSKLSATFSQYEFIHSIYGVGYKFSIEATNTQGSDNES